MINGGSTDTVIRIHSMPIGVAVGITIACGHPVVMLLLLLLRRGLSLGLSLCMLMVCLVRVLLCMMRLLMMCPRRIGLVLMLVREDVV